MIEQSGKESRALVEGRATDSRGVSAGASGRVVSGSEWQAFKEQAAFFVKSGLLPRAVVSVEAALTIMVTGYELGIGPMQALRLISVVQGKPVCAAELMAALVYRDHGDEALCVEESTAERCIVSYKRRCWTERKTHTFSMVDARTAGLAGKDTWKSYPAAMLRARCISAVARMAFPDTISGLYTPEEIAPEHVHLSSEGDVVYDGPALALGPEPASAAERSQETHEEAEVVSFTERAPASTLGSGALRAAEGTPQGPGEQAAAPVGPSHDGGKAAAGGTGTGHAQREGSFVEQAATGLSGEPKAPDGTRLGEKARAFWAQIEAANTYEEVNGQAGIAWRIRAASRAKEISGGESTVLFDTINKRNAQLRGSPGSSPAARAS